MMSPRRGGGHLQDKMNLCTVQYSTVLSHMDPVGMNQHRFERRRQQSSPKSSSNKKYESNRPRTALGTSGEVCSFSFASILLN